MDHADIRFVTANGLRFALLEEGEGPLVLMLHGFPDTPQTWDVARPALAAAGFRVVTPFMRGYHPTEIPTVEAFDQEMRSRSSTRSASATRSWWGTTGARGRRTARSGSHRSACDSS